MTMRSRLSGVVMTCMLVVATAPVLLRSAAHAAPLAVTDAASIWPTTGWMTAEPSALGMNPAQLERARDAALRGGGSGYITRGGRLVMSWGDPTQRYAIRSSTKSIGVTVLGLAVKDHLLQLGDFAQQYLDNIGLPPDTNATTGWLDEITLLQLATHTAGFDKTGGYIELLFEPGSIWSYSDGGANWLADLLTVVYRQDLQTLMFERVFSSLGITASDLSWRKNIYRSTTIDGIPSREFGSGISVDVDAMARIGYLYLRRGWWDGRRILPESFVDRVRQPVPAVMGLPVKDPANHFNASDHYGLLWWNNADGTMAGVPTDTYWSWGLGDSLIVVIPSLDIVVARAGTGWRLGWNSDYSVIEPFIQPIAESVTDAARFTDVTSEAGISGGGGWRGAAWADYDGNGCVDLFLSGDSRSVLYGNDCDGTFQDVTGTAGVEGAGSQWGPAWADGDGDLDLAVGRQDGANYLYRNNGDGTFTDVAVAAGVADMRSTAGVTWGDYDNDGHLDLFVANRFGDEDRTDGLFANNGDGTFTDVALAAGVRGSRLRMTSTGVWFDYDNDGFQDLYLAVDSADDVLYHNERNGTFSDASRAAGISDPQHGAGVSVGDINQDGCMDVLSSNNTQGAPGDAEHNASALYLNNCNGTFTRQSETLGILDRAVAEWGLNFIDFDNDMDLDASIVAGGLLSSGEPNVLYENSGSSLSDVTVRSGASNTGAAFGSAWADYDDDGDLDWFIANAEGSSALLRNDGPSGNYLKIDLSGAGSNTRAVGAIIRVTAGGATQTRVVQAGNSYASMDDSAPLFGLGASDAADEVVVLWPSGAQTTLTEIAANQTLAVTESGANVLLSSVLPASRSVELGHTATAFATILNTGAVLAADCGITPITRLPARFAYQTTSAATNALTGSANTPVDIAAGVSRSFVFAFTPTAEIAPDEVQLSFDCSNTDPAPVTVGLNTLLLSASRTPVPDIVALAATPSGQGSVVLPGATGTSAFAVASVNVGSQGTVTATADTGDTALPVMLSICQTRGAGVCTAAPTSRVTTTIDALGTNTFSIFVTGAGAVPFDPAHNRIFVRFKDGGGVTRGSTSVAVTTAPGR